MILPTTYVSVLALLMLSFVCLGSWPNLFKLTGPRWRFELFYFDFAFGALLLSAIIAYTLGTMGSELGFTDRMLVAGRTAQALAIAAGFIFNLGNMLLLAAVSLIGLSGAFAIALGTAFVVESLFAFRGTNIIFLIGGIVLAVVAVILNVRATRIRDQARQKPGSKTRSTRGIAVALLGGIIVGLFYPVAAKGVIGEFGIGPYAGALLLAVGIFISTAIFNLYFLNISIVGEPLTLRAYFRGNAKQHFLGFLGGVIFAAGILAAILARTAPPQADVDEALTIIFPLASVLLAIFWGATSWKEFAGAPAGAKTLLAFTAVLLAGAILLFGMGAAR